MPEKEIAEHVLICARKLYEETDLQSEFIAQLTGFSVSGLHKRGARLGWTPRQRFYRGTAASGAEPDVVGVSARITHQIGQRIAEVERNLAKPGPRAARLNDSERAARTLASLAKTLNELKRLEAGTGAAPKAEDDEIDLDEFERDIARHLAELRAPGRGSEQA